MDDALAATFAAMNKRLERIAVEMHDTNELLTELLEGLERTIKIEKPTYPGH